MPMKKPKRQLVIKIMAPGMDREGAVRWLLKLHEEGPLTVKTPPSAHIHGDMLLLDVALSDDEIDPYLRTFSELVEADPEGRSIFHRGMEIEVSDGESTEYVKETSSFILPGGWQVCLLGQDREDTPPSPGAETIILKTRCAFGTGRHPSTIGAVSALQMLYENGSMKDAKILDMGTGTAILAILAAKMGAAEVLGLDIDHRILADARQNIVLNSLSEKIKVSSKPIDALNLKNQDVIVANLTPSVLFKLLDKLVDALAPKGFLILSGYRPSPGHRLEHRLHERGLKRLHHVDVEGWCTEIFRFCLE